MPLTNEKCVACRADSPKVTPEEMADLKPQVPEWQVTEVDGVPRLERTFKFPDFANALEFTTRIGKAADEEDHHPRMTLEWGRVKVEWWTHKIKGLHRNDFVMAARTDDAYSAFAPVTGKRR